MYLTPAKYRVGGFGVDLSGLDDVELRNVLHRATAMVDEYCSVPLMPVKHDFRGGTILDEQVRWRIGHPLLEGQRRVYVMHRPVRAALALSIDITNHQFVTFSVPELYVTRNYIEITSLAMTSFGLFGAAIVPNIGLLEPMARASYTYGYVFNAVDEELEITDGTTYRALNQFWHTSPDPVVRVDGTEPDPGDYEINYSEGTVTFDEPLTASERVYATYSHKLPPAIAEATGIVATDLLGDRGIARRGMQGLVSMTVGEVSLRRDVPRRGVELRSVHERAATLLDPYRFITVAG